MEKFIPDMYQKNIYDINYDLLKKKGIKCLLFDLDNTIVPAQFCHVHRSDIDTLHIPAWIHLCAVHDPPLFSSALSYPDIHSRPAENAALRTTSQSFGIPVPPDISESSQRSDTYNESPFLPTVLFVNTA